MSVATALLLFLAFIVSYKLYKIFGKKNVGITVKVVKDKEDIESIIHETVKQQTQEDVVKTKETSHLKPQWNMLKDLDKTISETSLKNEFVDFFKKLYHAFSTGSIESIKDHLSDDVRMALEEAFQSRQDKSYSYVFKTDPVCEIKEINFDDDNICSISVELKSDQVVQIKDSEGNVLDNPQNIEETVVDNWVLQRNFDEKSSTWKLVHME